MNRQAAFPAICLSLLFVSTSHAAPEALWTKEGALCLDNTRISSAMFAVEEKCDIPKCNEMNPKLYDEDIVWSTQVVY